MGLGPLWFNVILAIVFICFNALNSQHAFTLAAGTSGWSSTKKLAIRCANSSSTETQMLRLRCSEKVRELFERYDSDKDDNINLNELALLLQEISSLITTLPAVRTASRLF